MYLPEWKQIGMNLVLFNVTAGFNCKWMHNPFCQSTVKGWGLC